MTLLPDGDMHLPGFFYRVGRVYVIGLMRVLGYREGGGGGYIFIFKKLDLGGRLI